MQALPILRHGGQAPSAAKRKDSVSWALWSCRPYPPSLVFFLQALGVEPGSSSSQNRHSHKVEPSHRSIACSSAKVWPVGVPRQLPHRPCCSSACYRSKCSSCWTKTLQEHCDIPSDDIDMKHTDDKKIKQNKPASTEKSCLELSQYAVHSICFAGGRPTDDLHHLSSVQVRAHSGKNTHTPSSTMQICVQGLSQSVYHTKLWITATNKAQALAKMLTKPCNTSRCFASNSTRCHQNQWNGINPPHLHHLVHERHNVMSNRLWTSVWSRQGWNALYPSHCTNPLCTVCNNGLGVTILFSCKVDRASHNWTNSFLHYRDDHTDAKKVLLAVDIIGSPLQWANQQQQAALLQRSFTDSLDK